MLKDRAIFLTGGGTGLGRSMALHFAMLGARMFLVGRREQPLKDVSDEIRRGGGSAAYATCDVRDYGAVETAANLAYEQFGRIDSLINNKRMSGRGSSEASAFTSLIHDRGLQPSTRAVNRVKRIPTSLRRTSITFEPLFQ